MKAFFWGVGSLVLILVLFAIAGLHIMTHYEAGAPPISSSKAIILLNNCTNFIHVGASTRQATSATNISKGSGGMDAASNVSFSDIRWQWTSGPNTMSVSEGSGKASFRWTPVDGLSDWNFPESQWSVSSFDDQREPEPCFRYVP